MALIRVRVRVEGGEPRPVRRVRAPCTCAPEEFVPRGIRRIRARSGDGGTDGHRDVDCEDGHRDVDCEVNSVGRVLTQSVMAPCRCCDGLGSARPTLTPM